jgi:hypothetical protein
MEMQPLPPINAQPLPPSPQHLPMQPPPVLPHFLEPAGRRIICLALLDICFIIMFGALIMTVIYVLRMNCSFVELSECVVS